MVLRQFFLPLKSSKNTDCNKKAKTMEHPTTMNLLKEPNHFKLITRKWDIVNDQSNANYDVRH